MNSVFFSIFSDLHVDITPLAPGHFREYAGTVDARRPDFVIQLGDLWIVRPWIPEYLRSPDTFVMKEEYEPAKFDYHVDYYKRYLEVYERIPELYTVLGNHDHDRAGKDDVCRFYHMAAPYYSFVKNGFKFIALDTNNYIVDGEFIPYDRQNYMKDKREGKRTDALGKEQLAWLREELLTMPSDIPAVLLSHAALDTDVYERDEFAGILNEAKRAGKKIMFCANGHNHIDFLSQTDGVYYWEVNSMTYRFLGRNYPPVDRFGEESKRYPNARYAGVYDKPLYAYVTLSEDGTVKIEGTDAEYLPPLPESIGFKEKPGAKPGAPRITSRTFKAF